MAHLRERGFVESHVLATQERNQALAFDVRRHRQACQFAQGWIDIEKFGEGRDASATGETGGGDHERRAGGILVVGELSPMTVLAEMPAVVAPEADDGVVRHAAFLQRLHEQTDLRIDIRNTGGVAVDELRVAAASGIGPTVGMSE
jgi:hypothetical protein